MKRQRERWSKDEGLCKGGKTVFVRVPVRACVCALLINVKSLSEPRGTQHIP